MKSFLILLTLLFVLLGFFGSIAAVFYFNKNTKFERVEQK